MVADMARQNLYRPVCLAAERSAGEEVVGPADLSSCIHFPTVIGTHVTQYRASNYVLFVRTHLQPPTYSSLSIRTDLHAPFHRRAWTQMAEQFADFGSSSELLEVSGTLARSHP